MLKLGQLPLRWAGTLDQGFGIPLFTFIYPLPYYLSSVLSRAVGSVWAVKIVMFSAYLAGGWGIYRLFAKVDRVVAITLAFIYLMTPYQYVNLFVRGAFGEVVAMGLIPWVMVSLQSLQSPTQKLRWYHPIPLGLLLLAHNFLGILFAGFLVGYGLFLGRARAKTYLSLILSFGLAAFFLIPMFFERGLLYSLENQFFTFRYDQHFVTLKQLLYSKWDYWYSVPGDADGMSFQLGFAPFLLALIGSGFAIFSREQRTRNCYLVFAYLGTLFLMTARSFPIWDHLTLLQTVQFPWRLLFMAAILSPLLGAIWLVRFKSPRKKFLILSLLLALAFWNVRNYRRPMKQLSEAEYTDLYRLNFGKTTTTFRTEILPKWSVPNERYKSDEILVNSGNMTLDALAYNPLKLTVTITNKPDPAESRVTILRNYYPSWHLVNEAKEEIELKPTQDGMIQFSPALGAHVYTLEQKSTKLEQIANSLSVITILYLVYLGMRSIWDQRAT